MKTENPPGPREYAAAGFRILPISSAPKGDDMHKRPLVDGFGAAFPDFTCSPNGFVSGDLCAILCGPCPALGEDYLIVLDLDGETTLDEVNDHVGVDLPETLSSKNYHHFFFRVPPSEYRDALGSWVRVFGRGEGAPELDTKWCGGYAIQPPGAWDEGFDPSAIATLPTEWLARVFELRHQRPRATSGGAPAVRPAQGQPWPDGEGMLMLAATLGVVWPQPGEGCHEAALALGGILADSWLDEVGIAQFASTVFEAAGTLNRTADVLHSVNTKMNGGKCKGWPSLKAILKEANRGDWEDALAMLKNETPGLKAPSPADVVQGEQAKRAGAVGDRNHFLDVGDETELAKILLGQYTYSPLQEPFACHGAFASDVNTEGDLWYRGADQCWHKRHEDSEIARAVARFHGVEVIPSKGKAHVLRVPPTLAKRVKACMLQMVPEREGFFQNPPGVAFRNGWLDLNDGFAPWSAAKVNVRSVLDFDFDRDVLKTNPPREWVKFCQSVWGDDKAAVQLLHEILGYLISGATHIHKIFLFIGPKRGGKGTVFNLIGKILGDACGSFKVNQLGQEFGLQEQVGKSVSIDPDVRRSTSRNKDEAAVVERLLSISANDRQRIPRKFLAALMLRLGLRLLLGANPPFGLQDVGAALADRLIILTFPKSFLGKEDAFLEDKLTAEIPGIIALAVEAFAALKSRGRFVEPESSADERQSVYRAEQPMLDFLDDCCELAADFTVGCDALFQAASKWREANGHGRIGNAAFGEFLRQRGIQQVRRRVNGAKQPRVYLGVRLAALAAAPDLSRPIGTAKILQFPVSEGCTGTYG